MSRLKDFYKKKTKENEDWETSQRRSQKIFSKNDLALILPANHERKKCEKKVSHITIPGLTGLTLRPPSVGLLDSICNHIYDAVCECGRHQNL